MIVMPFGKHKGKQIDELPSSYLLWMCENFDESKSDFTRILIAEANEEYDHRERYNCHFEEEG